MNDINTIRLAFEWYRKPSLKTELVEQIKLVRNYCKAYRQGAYDYLLHYPCGYQDSHGMEVEKMFNKLAALKLAWRMNKDGLYALKKELNKYD